mmetsp:Transcript_19498/g.49948  ORF Transcript_19498/g.49948 Transcript_19498/m.49948 type:complete len:95 (+) Transcript_19498:40-324(+)
MGPDRTISTLADRQKKMLKDRMGQSPRHKQLVLRSIYVLCISSFFFRFVAFPLPDIGLCRVDVVEVDEMSFVNGGKQMIGLTPRQPPQGGGDGK